jgi:hypothetical protein
MATARTLLGAEAQAEGVYPVVIRRSGTGIQFAPWRLWCSREYGLYSPRQVGGVLARRSSLAPLGPRPLVDLGLDVEDDLLWGDAHYGADHFRR